MNPTTVLWIYIILLLVGGLFGYFKGKSQISLITSASAAAILVLAAIPLFRPSMATLLADIVMAALLVVFAVRLAKTKKFMPSGMLLVVTAAALAARHLRF
jgi:uncharacterized membrane protein (UPF0136 family)